MTLHGLAARTALAITAATRVFAADIQPISQLRGVYASASGGDPGRCTRQVTQQFETDAAGAFSHRVSAAMPRRPTSGAAARPGRH
jgi:hypothetical protein